MFNNRQNWGKTRWIILFKKSGENLAIWIKESSGPITLYTATPDVYHKTNFSIIIRILFLYCSKVLRNLKFLFRRISLKLLKALYTFLQYYLKLFLFLFSRKAYCWEKTEKWTSHVSGLFLSFTCLWIQETKREIFTSKMFFIKRIFKMLGFSVTNLKLSFHFRDF